MLRDSQTDEGAGAGTAPADADLLPATTYPESAMRVGPPCGAETAGAWSEARSA